MRLRQICNHPLLVANLRDFEEIMDGDDIQMNASTATSDPVAKLNPTVVRRLNEQETSILDSECPICIDVFSDGMLLPKCGMLSLL